MTISKAEFVDWKKDPVTKAFFVAVENRIEDAKDVMSVSAGLDQVQDCVTRGMITAFREVLNIEFSEVESEDA